MLPWSSQMAVLEGQGDWWSTRPPMSQVFESICLRDLLMWFSPYLCTAAIWYWLLTVLMGRTISIHCGLILAKLSFCCYPNSRPPDLQPLTPDSRPLFLPRQPRPNCLKVFWRAELDWGQICRILDGMDVYSLVFFLIDEVVFIGTFRNKSYDV